MEDIPPSEEWDLVVSSPPLFIDNGFGQLRYHDPDWRVHRGFFGAVSRHLKSSGVVVLQETTRALHLKRSLR